MSSLHTRTLVGLLVLGIVTAVSFAAAQGTPAQSARDMLVYIGTYTDAGSKGIYASRLNMGTGQLSAPQVMAETLSPSFLAIHPTKRVLYAVNEVDTFNGNPGGGLTAFAIGANGALTKLNEQSAGGPGPCHLSVDRAGNFVFAANYGGGSIVALSLAADGRFDRRTAFVQHAGSSVHPNQRGPHAHAILTDPANRFVVAVDLGVNRVLVYRFDAKTGTLTPHNPTGFTSAPGAGPRHLEFAPNRQFAYVINELNSTMTALKWDAANGTLTEVQTLPTLPAGVTAANTTAEVRVHPSGRFVYGSNRGHNSIAIFAVDQSTGRMTVVGHQSTGGRTPRNFSIDPTGTWLLAANQESDSIVTFRIDAQSGRLTPAGSPVQVSRPVSLEFFDRP